MVRASSLITAVLAGGLVVGGAQQGTAATATVAAAPVSVAPADVVVRPWPVYQQGSREENVAVLQYLLRGYSSAFSQLAVDGIFGSNTAEAVRDYQRNRGLVVDGIVGPQTWSKLTSEAVLRADPRPSDWVRALQTELRRNDYEIAVDGVFGSDTEHAVRETQRGAGLVVDGIAGPRTWRDLVTRHRI